jgi:hypothetical protein
MASVAPPVPSYRPHLPTDTITNGLLSDAQLESVIYAGEAHSQPLAGSWTVDETYDLVRAARDGADNAVRFRRGWFLGDGTGAGKGRQVAGILLDNWLKGRRRAVWISKSDKLIEDAQRDWSALGMERLLVTPLSRFRQGTSIRLEQGVLFTTYATLRSDARDEKASRAKQIVEWLGADFDGVIIFDESHAMQNAAGGKGERGDQAASQQDRAGLRLQHALPNARIVYVSATGATTVHNLAYAQRLGLWGGEDFPFATRSEFVEAIEAGGVAAMEVLARDLKALGLYAARSLSYEGIEYELIEHQLTDEQIRIYDSYAGAFAIIHNNLAAAMQAANITGATGTLNAQAKSAARSAFESAKQRFFNHLITAMKTPSLIASIERDLRDGHAAVIQIVSTGEALMERRLAEIPTEEWGDVQVDITPREYVLDYLAHSFPTQLYEPFTDSEGNLSSRPAFRDGQPVQCRDAVARRDHLIEKLASLTPVHGPLDQIVQRFGTDIVAEVTGRSRRIIRKTGSDGVDRLVVENRAGSANLGEAQAFMDNVKRILVFSDAGGTGRSYHAELSAKNRRLRVHYLLEAGWKADAAIQGLGRTTPQTHWREADRDTFARAWAAEIAEVPEFTDSEIHIVAGLLLPIWKRLPNESIRVYRLQTDTGERIIGRKVSPAWVAGALESGSSNLSPVTAFAALIDGMTSLDLAEGLQVRRVRVMAARTGSIDRFSEPMRDRLRAYGLFGEIISWNLRFFVPVDATGPAILAECWSAIRSCASPIEWRRDMPRTRRAGVASRARPRRCVVIISQRTSRRQLLAGRRRQELGGPIDVRPPEGQGHRWPPATWTDGDRRARRA